MPNCLAEPRIEIVTRFPFLGETDFGQLVKAVREQQSESYWENLFQMPKVLVFSSRNILRQITAFGKQEEAMLVVALKPPHRESIVLGITKAVRRPYPRNEQKQKADAAEEMFVENQTPNSISKFSVSRSMTDDIDLVIDAEVDGFDIPLDEHITVRLWREKARHVQEFHVLGGSCLLEWIELMCYERIRPVMHSVSDTNPHDIHFSLLNLFCLSQ